MPEVPTPGAPWWRNRWRLAAIFGVAISLGVVGYLVYDSAKRPADVRNVDVPFNPEPPKRPKVHLTSWPIFGLDRGRTRYLPAKGLKPPFRKLWKYNERPLLEFPPVYARRRLWGLNNNGLAFSLDARTGKVLWERQIGELNASSPAYARGRLFVVNLVPGQALALDAKTGKTIWRRPLPGRAESSPIVIGHTVYFGCENGQLFALNTRNGKTKWTATLAGEVKAAPAYNHGRLFVGDYGGEMSAVDAKSGRIVWQASAQGGSFGRTGAFYSTPAVAFGRVYSGNNDGRVYSFDARTGELAWSYSTGGYVYSGPAVADTKTTPPTVYVGSFDGNVYALDARTGGTRWTAPAGGRVSGSLSVVGNIVYVSQFDDTSTRGFHVRTGKKVFGIHTGAYTPVISDGRHIYLTGYSSITALEPIRRERGKKTGARQQRRQDRRDRGG
jgi:outer membrane protein assembly factor BamB